jgi:hypothetical protein
MAKPGKAAGAVKLGDFVQEVIKLPGFGECLRLCAVAELEQVCALIPEAFHAARHGHAASSGLHSSLMQHLYGPVFRFIEELERWQEEEQASRLKKLEAYRGKGFKRELEQLTNKRLQIFGPWPEPDEEALRIHEDRSRPLNIGPVVREELQPSLDFLEHIEGVADHIEFGPWSEADEVACTDRLRQAWYKWIAYLSSCWMSTRVPEELARPLLARRNGRMPARDGKPGRPAKLDKTAMLKAYDELLPSKGSGTADIVAARFGCDPQTVRKHVRQRDREKNEPNPAG